MAYNPPIGSIYYHLYTAYILPFGGLYATYHLLGEPETTIELNIIFILWYFVWILEHRPGLYHSQSPEAQGFMHGVGCFFLRITWVLSSFNTTSEFTPEKEHSPANRHFQGLFFPFRLGIWLGWINSVSWNSTKCKCLAQKLTQSFWRQGPLIFIEILFGDCVGLGAIGLGHGSKLTTCWKSFQVYTRCSDSELHDFAFRVVHDLVLGLDMGVSKNTGTPKWMVYNGKSY